MEARRHHEMMAAADAILGPDGLDRGAIEARILGSAAAAPERATAEISEPLGEAGLGEDGDTRASHHVVALHQRQLADPALAPAAIGEGGSLVQAHIVEAGDQLVPIAGSALVNQDLDGLALGRGSALPPLIMPIRSRDAHDAWPSGPVQRPHWRERQPLPTLCVTSRGSGPLRERRLKKRGRPLQA